jgi:hypothetical protein
MHRRGHLVERRRQLGVVLSVLDPGNQADVEAVERGIVDFVYFVRRRHVLRREYILRMQARQGGADGVGDELGTQFAALRHVGNLEVRVSPAAPCRP